MYEVKIYNTGQTWFLRTQEEFREVLRQAKSLGYSYHADNGLRKWERIANRKGKR